MTSEFGPMQEGDVFMQKYRVETLLGAGGFAAVYRAFDQTVGRRVAIKVLRPIPKTHKFYSERTQRFAQEARMIAELRDPHTVTLFEFGEAPDGLLYMVMEYVDGSPIDELMTAGVPMSPDRVVRIIGQVLESLKEAHARGIIHRDIKPANIIVYDYLDKRDCVKVVDFGISKIARPEDALEMTQEGRLIGTPRYMAPEQVRGEAATAAADIYALGLVAFELIAGHKAIQTNSGNAMLAAHLDEKPFVVPEGLGPRNLKAVIDTMLRKDLRTRYPSASAVLTDLAKWRGADLDATTRDAFAPIDTTTQDDYAAPTDETSRMRSGVHGPADESVRLQARGGGWFDHEQDSFIGPGSNRGAESSPGFSPGKAQRPSAAFVTDIHDPDVGEQQAYSQPGTGGLEVDFDHAMRVDRKRKRRRRKKNTFWATVGSVIFFLIFAAASAGGVFFLLMK